MLSAPQLDFFLVETRIGKGVFDSPTGRSSVVIPGRELDQIGLVA